MGGEKDKGQKELQTAQLDPCHEGGVGWLGWACALFDTHTVRTAPETAMGAISPDGKVLRVEV